MEFHKTPSLRIIFLLILVTGFLFASSIPMVSIIISGLRKFGELSGICSNSGVDVLVYPYYAVFVLMGMVALMSLVIYSLLAIFTKFLVSI